MRLFKTILGLGLLFSMLSCQKQVDYSNAITDGHYLIKAQDRITEVIIHDIFSPPVAARIYSYSSLAAYEVAAATDPNYVSLLGQLNGSEKPPLPLLRRCTCRLLPLQHITMLVPV
ncbi:hypothetical protein V8V91_19565 [Algoriphagus halophilus]|uniref:hypothetical protein n=1 Tax=Algoriphagus halophilus TaxID=226505 RepID=UPI00358F69FC